MRISSIVSAAALAGAAAASAIEERDIGSFISSEKQRALQGVLANIGPDGALSQGAKAGVVIAAPSTVNPNYLYTWTRDSALTLKMLVDEFIAGNRGLERHIKDYVHAQAVLQTVTNPSGTLQAGDGLGEPKYNIDITRFNGAWGRPQRDGPALRAVALMAYINELLRCGETDEAKRVVWPIVQNDLSYVGQFWNQTGFDLWEETSGSSFFTIQNQHRALAQGATLAKRLGTACKACETVAPELLCFLQTFWNGTSLVANTNVDNGRSGRDSNTMLGAIATFDIDAACDDPSMQPCSSKVLASHKVLVDSFRAIYPLNAQAKPGTAAAVGRYPEDVYYGGNPWYLCTLAAAEVLYDAAAQFKARGALTVDSTNLAFFRDLDPAAKKGTYRAGATLTHLTQAMAAYADGFVGVVQAHLPKNGSLSEQFDRATGQPLSAYDLTWSFASFVTMAQRRAGHYPASWGSAHAAAPACGTAAPKGTYVPAVAAGAPNVTGACTVATTFNVNASTYFGENIYLVGNTSDTGAWDPANADGMGAGNYTSARHLWDLTIELDAGEFLDYKYLRQESDGSWIFETVNRTLAVPACGAAGPVTNDAWTGPGGGD